MHAKVGLDEFVVRHDLAGFCSCDNLAGVDDHDIVRQTQSEVRVLLHQDNLQSYAPQLGDDFSDFSDHLSGKTLSGLVT